MSPEAYERSGEPPTRLPRRAWYLVAALGVVALVLGLVAGLTAVGSDDPVVLDDPDSYGIGGSSVATVPSTPTTTSPSALPGFEPPEPGVPVGAGLIDAGSSPVDPYPVAITIDAIGVSAPVVAVGVSGDEMEIPPTVRDVGWYRYGPLPGEQGSAVLAAHVSWLGARGAFYDLRSLAAGSIIEVAFSDDTVRSFRAVTLTSYDKSDLPTDEIFRRDGPPVLTLITCGGAFNPSLNSFEANVVAYAVEVEAPEVR